MGISQTDRRMEGWLYLIRFNPLGVQYSLKKYFVLQYNCLKSFKSVPTSNLEVPERSATIDSCLRVTDNGREILNSKIFFIFTLCNTLNPNDQLKLGACSPEEADGWIHSLQDIASKQCPDPVKNCMNRSKRKWKPFRLCSLKKVGHNNSTYRTHSSSMNLDAMASDVITPSPWKIFRCQNGLRFFKEAKEWDISGRHWDDHPAIMAIGVVDGSSEAIFSTLLSLGPSRSEWDFCFCKGGVIEHIDDNTDIVHEELYSDWLPWSMKRRDVLLHRYWRREEGGTYVILYHSVFHKKCPPLRGFVRASIKSGGYVISPSNHGNQSIVKHMLAIDWKFWKSYVQTSSERSVTIRMLERVAALRELFGAKAGNYSFSDFDLSFGEFTEDIGLPPARQRQKENIIKTEVQFTDYKNIGENLILDGVEKLWPSRDSSLMGMNDAGDEFFDVPEPLDSDHSEEESNSNLRELLYMDRLPPKVSAASGFVKKLDELGAWNNVYVDLQETGSNESMYYGNTLPKDINGTLACSWSPADPSTFLIRGITYLKDHHKVKAKHSLMQMVGVDWLKSNKREDDLAGRTGSIVQKSAANGGPEFFIIINMQVPCTTPVNLALYYMTKTPLEETHLLERFVNGDDVYRNSRFKIIPCVSKGSWIVKQSVGKKACLVSQSLEINYFRGRNYLELGVNVGSSAVARGAANLVFGYLSNLVIELAFLIQDLRGSRLVLAVKRMVYISLMLSHIK